MAALICLAVFLAEPAATLLGRGCLYAIAAAGRLHQRVRLRRERRPTLRIGLLFLASLAALGAGIALLQQPEIPRAATGSIWLLGALGLLLAGILGAWHESPREVE